MRSDYTETTDPVGKVLIIVENLPVPADRRVWQEATTLRRAGYGVSVICPKGKGYDSSYEKIDGIHVYRHSLPRERSGALGYLLEYSAALYWQLVLSMRVRRRHGFDVLQACNPPDLIFLIGLFHKLLFGTRFLYDQHDLCPELYRVKFGRMDWLYRLLVRLERWTFRTADGSLATNETLKELAINRGGMARDRVWTVRSCPDLSRWKPAPPDHAAKRGFKHLVGYVGIMAEQDGVDLLVKAMVHVKGDLGRRDIGCLIIGDGPQLARLQALAQSLEVDDCVEFAGYQSGDALMSKLAACAVGVIPDPPNGCNEKLSMNKVFEYMAMGLPFVMFDLMQARKEAGAAGRVVYEPTPLALARAMVELVDDEPRRQTMGAYGREKAQREYIWDNEASALLAAYDTLLADPAARPAEALRPGL